MSTAEKPARENLKLFADVEIGPEKTRQAVAKLRTNRDDRAGRKTRILRLAHTVAFPRVRLAKTAGLHQRRTHEEI